MAETPTSYTPVSAWSSISVVERARKKVDEELAALEHAQRQWRTRRNALSRSCALPPELLSLIFLYCADGAVDYRGRYYRQLMWIKVTHVCRHWRDTALSCPALWAKITCRTIPATEELIKRSGNASLYVSLELLDAPIDYGDSNSARGRALDEISRIRELDLSFSARTAGEVFKKLTMPAPLLQSLMITNGHNHDYYTPATHDGRLSLPGNFLNGHAPALRKLKLLGCNIPWDLPILQGLTELDIALISETALPTLRQLLNILGNMPALRKLSLEEALPRLVSDVDARHVHLSELQELSVTGSPSQCAELLSHLTFPETSRIQLSCKGGSEEYARIIPFLAQKCFAPLNSEEPTETLQIWSDLMYGSYGVYFGLRPLSAQTTQPYSYGRTKEYGTLVDLKAFQTMWSMTDFLVSLFAQLTLTGVRALVIKNLPILSEELWRSLLTSTSRCKALDLECADASAVTCLMSELYPRDRPSPETVRLPHLDKLVLRNVEFEDSILDLSEVRPFVSLDELYDFFIARVNAGAPLGELVLRECFNFYKASKEYLQEIVPHVDWDRIEQGLSEEDENERDWGDYSDDGYFGWDDYSI